MMRRRVFSSTARADKAFPLGLLNATITGLESGKSRVLSIPLLRTGIFRETLLTALARPKGAGQYFYSLLPYTEGC